MYLPLSAFGSFGFTPPVNDALLLLLMHGAILTSKALYFHKFLREVCFLFLSLLIMLL